MYKSRLILRSIREGRGMSIANVAAQLRLSAAQVSRIETGAADTTVRRLRQFADLYGLPLPELFQDHLPPAPGTVMQVRGEICTGRWIDDAQSRRLVVMPRMNFDLAKIFALACNDPAMDRVYPKNTLVACLPMDTLDRDLTPGDHLVSIQRDDQGRAQRLLRELRNDKDGQNWLWPRSTHPEYQQPTRVTATLELEGIVVASFVQRIRV